MARQAAQGVPTMAGTLPFIGAGAGIGSLIAPGVGTVVGGLVGALGGGTIVSMLQNKLREAGEQGGYIDPHGWLGSKQEAADVEQHPYASTTGRLLSMLPFFGAGAMTIPQRLMGAGLFSTIEGVQEGLQEGKIDPGRVALTAIAGGLMGKPRGFAQRAMNAGESLVPGATEQASRIRGVGGLYDRAKAEHAVQTKPGTMDTPGTEAPPPVENPPSPDLGNPQSAPARSSRAGGKRYRAGNKALPIKNVAPDVEAALGPDTGGVINPETPAGWPEHQRGGKAYSQASDFSGLTEEQLIERSRAERAAVDNLKNKTNELQQGEAFRPGPDEVMAEHSVAPLSEADYGDAAIAQAEKRAPFPIAQRATAEKSLGQIEPTGAEHPDFRGAKIVRDNMLPNKRGELSPDKQTYYVDSRLPERIMVDGEPLDPAQPLMVRDMVEQTARENPHVKLSKKDIKAIGQTAEKEWLESRGYNYEAYQRALNGEAPVPGAVPSVVRALREYMTSHGMKDQLAAFDKLPAEEQAAGARRALEHLSNRGGKAKVAKYSEVRKPPKVYTVEGLTDEQGRPITARDKADAARKSKAVASVKSAFEAFPPGRENDPLSLRAIKALRERAQAAVEHATKENGGKSPLDTYKSRAALQTKEYQWLRALKRLADSRMTKKQVMDFIATETQLRAGTKADVENVRQGVRIKADIERSRAPTVEQVETGESKSKLAPQTAEDWANMSTEDLNNLAAEKAKSSEPEVPAWRQAELDREAKMAKQKAARLAKEGKAPEPEPAAAPKKESLGMTARKHFGLKMSMGASVKSFWEAAGIKGSLFHRIFSPATVSQLADDAAALIRERGGVHARELAQAVHRIEQFRKLVNTLPEQKRIDFMIAMDEGTAVDPVLEPLAKVMRPAFESIKNQIAALPSHAQQEFVLNYFPHMWKNHMTGETFVGNYFQKQGSAASLHARSIPTIREGLKAGLTLASTDPVEVMLRYMGSMSNYLRAQEILERAINDGVVKTFDTNGMGASGHGHTSQIPAGYVKLQGRTLSPMQNFYAPADWARVYNNFLDPGFARTPEGGDLYRGLQRAFNTVTSLELGLSAYHVFTMVTEATISDMAMGMSQLFHGEFARSARTFAKAPGAAVLKARLGSKVQAEYLRPGAANSAEMSKIVDLMERSGARPVGRGHDITYQYTNRATFQDAYSRGTLRRELLEAVKNVTGEKKITGKALNTANEVFTLLQRGMQSASAPIFDTYIPKLKAGAFADTLGEYIRAHPAASDKELLAAARRIGDSIDNRFGEMVHDNVFWNTALKQGAMLSMRSYTWNLGTIREIGGGIVGAVTHPSRLSIGSPDYDPRIAYVVAAPFAIGLISATYQFLKTGKPPQEMADLALPKTGGRNVYGTEERAILPGYEKDVLGWFENPAQEAINKIATAPRLVWEVLSNKDYTGNPIANGNESLPVRVGQYAQHVGESLGPISIKNLVKGSPRGSNVSDVERAVAIRPSPAWTQNKRFIDLAIRRRNQRDWEAKLRHDARMKAQNR